MNDSLLSDRLHDLAGPEPTSEPPVATLLRRGRRARRRRHAVTAASAVLAAAVAIGGVAVVVTDPRPASREAPAVVAAAPELDLVAAIAASQDISYRVRINVALRRTGSAMSEEDRRLWEYVGEKGHDIDGAFDPRTSTGFRRSEFMEERLINGTLYTAERGSPRFSVVEGVFTTIPWGDDLTVSAGNADPARVLPVLRDRGVTTRTDATTWHVRYEVPAQPHFPTGRVIEGDITVGDDNRVRRIRYEPTRPAGAGNPGLGRPVRESGVQHVITIDLFGYGTPVEVEVPPTR